MKSSGSKAMYRMSARQIIAVAFLSAVFAAVSVACFDRWGARLQQPAAAFNPDDPGATTAANVAGITDPSVATDEQNNIEVFRSISPGVVSINSTSTAARLLRRGRAGLRLRLGHRRAGPHADELPRRRRRGRTHRQLWRREDVPGEGRRRRPRHRPRRASSNRARARL